MSHLGILTENKALLHVYAADFFSNLLFRNPTHPVVDCYITSSADYRTRCLV